MAVSVKISDLSIKEKKIIVLSKVLRIKPIKTIFNKFSSQPCITFYIKDKENVLVPYHFFYKLRKKIPNVLKEYPREKISFKGTLRPLQKNVIVEAKEHLEKYGSTTIVLPPGSGKSIIGAYLSSYLSYKTIILFPRILLGKQLKKTFDLFTDATTWIVGEEKPKNPNVVLCLDKKVKKLSKEYRKTFGLLIIDEAHTFCSKTQVQNILAFEPKNVILQTATNEREDGLSLILQLLAGKHIVKRDRKVNFKVVKSHTQIVPKKIYNTNGVLNWAGVTKSLLYNKERNDIIISLIVNNINKKILILTNIKNHVMLLKNRLDILGIKNDYMCGTKKNYKDSNVLIGTTSKIGTGFDEKTVCDDFNGNPINFIVLCNSIKNISLLEQVIGRGFRSNYLEVQHLVDKDSIIEKHWKGCWGWYKKFGAIVTQDCYEGKDIRVLMVLKKLFVDKKVPKEIEQLIYKFIS